MQFRPCIDIHDGKVKQIVGSTLKDQGDGPKENFVSEKSAADYAGLYREDNLTGGHIILLNKAGTPEYEETKAAALAALSAFPGGMQVGGGITPDTAREFLDAGASHVIVTSYVFKDGSVNYENLRRLYDTVGKEHLVLDLSCKYVKKEDGDSGYYIVTDRWQNVTNVKINVPVLEEFAMYCSEFLIHAVDVEGRNSGIEKPLLSTLSEWNQLPITYAGGVHSMDDIDVIREIGKGRIHFTVGSALDLFGGSLSYKEIIKHCKF